MIQKTKGERIHNTGRGLQKRPFIYLLSAERGHETTLSTVVVGTREGAMCPHWLPDAFYSPKQFLRHQSKQGRNLNTLSTVQPLWMVPKQNHGEVGPSGRWLDDWDHRQQKTLMQLSQDSQFPQKQIVRLGPGRSNSWISPQGTCPTSLQPSVLRILSGNRTQQIIDPSLSTSKIRCLITLFCL